MNNTEENIVSVEINNERVYFEVPTKEEREKILTDASYAKQLYESLTSTNADYEHTENEVPETQTQTSSNFLQLPETHTSSSVLQEYESFLWNDKNTLLLLEEYRVRREEFRNPKMKKRNLWQQIVVVFAKHNYCVNEEILDEKFRNLKQTFMRIRDNQNTKTKTGQDNITWKYFELMCKIFSIDKTVNTDVITIESFLPPQKKFKSIEPLASPTCRLAPKLIEIGASGSNSPILHNFDSSLLKVTNKQPIQVKNDQKEYITTPTTKKKLRKGLVQYRQELLKTEKERTNEISGLRKLMEENNKLLKEMVDVAKEKNKLLTRLVEIEASRK